MRIATTVAISSVLGFVITFVCVPQREPEPIRSTRFELPGVPVAVEDMPVRDWQEANDALRQAMFMRHHEEGVVRGADGKPSETRSAGIRIQYRPYAGSADGDPSAVETVVVQRYVPAIDRYSRSNQDYIARYEIVRYGVE